MNRLSTNFFERDTIEVAKDLLGHYIVHKVSNNVLVSKIVEVEAYKGITDKACHSFGGKRTARTECMYKKGGTAYVYMIYGMYYCMNIVTEGKDNPCAVLIRGVQPIEGFEKMSQYRYNKSYNILNNRQKKNITNGPGKLCIAMNITKNNNGIDMCRKNSRLFIAENPNRNDFKINNAKRINIDYAQEAADYLWRFYIEGNKYVSA